MSSYTPPAWAATTPPAKSTLYGLDVLKDGVIVDHIDLTTRTHYVLGRAADACDIPAAHASVSRFHAVLQHSKHGHVSVYDLGSTHGTFFNRSKAPIEPRKHFRLRVGQMVRLGSSSRRYVLTGPEPPEEEEEAGVVGRQVSSETSSAVKLETQSLRREFLEGSVAQKGVAAAAAAAAEGAAQREAVLTVDDAKLRRGELTAKQRDDLQHIERKERQLATAMQEAETLERKAEQQANGLSEGQQRALDSAVRRVEKAESQLGEMVERLEESLLATHERKMGEEPSSSRKKRRRGSFDGDSDDDEFYDRTKASQEPPSKRSKTEMVEPDDIKDWVVEVLPMEKETLATLSSKLSQCRSNYSKLQEMLEELKTRSAAAADEAEDSLDAFMHGTVYAEEDQWRAKRVEGIMAKVLETQRQIKAMFDEKSAQKRVEKVRQQTRAERPQAASSAGLAAYIERGKKMEEQRKELERAMEQQRQQEEAQLRMPAREEEQQQQQPAAAAPKVSAKQALIDALQKRRERAQRTYQSTSSLPTRQSTVNQLGAINPAAGSGGLREVAPVAAPEAEPTHDERVVTWQPPKNQTGDGRTHLNDKYGY